MGVFNTKAILKGEPKLLPAIADRICKEFKEEGYDGYRDYVGNGSIDISLTKGDFFKSILGMDTALKIRLEPQDNAISFDAGIGIFGKETIPAIISCFFMWPLLLTQLWGLVKQSKIDDKALEIAKSVIKENAPAPQIIIIPAHQLAQNNAICKHCGTHLPNKAKFCFNCGSPRN